MLKTENYEYFCTMSLDPTSIAKLICIFPKISVFQTSLKLSNLEPYRRPILGQ